MTDNQRLMIQGMDMLLRKFSVLPDDTTITVLDLISASNDVYDNILTMDDTSFNDISRCIRMDLNNLPETSSSFNPEKTEPQSHLKSE